MTGLGFLDLVIGLIFIYFILSLVVSVVQEIRANLFSLRAKNLEHWFNETLLGEDNNLGKLIYKHKLISGLVRRSQNPSYVPNEHFVSALLDIVHNKGEDQEELDPYDIDTLKDSVKDSKLLPKDLKRYVLQSISEASGELKKVKTDISIWFDNAMTRVAGTYKNSNQWFVIAISVVVVAAMNADTISLSKYLYENEAARTELADQASEAINDKDIQELMAKYATINPDSLNEETVDSVKVIVENIQNGIEDVKAINSKIKDYNLPLGWSQESDLVTSKPESTGGWIMKIIGLLITALAVSIGSNFWFDMLNKLVNLRTSGSKPKEAADETKTTNKS